MLRRGLIFGSTVVIGLLPGIVFADRPLNELKQVQGELRSVAMPASEVIPDDAISLLPEYKEKALECIRSYITDHSWDNIHQLNKDLITYLGDHAIMEAKQDEPGDPKREEPFSHGYLCRLQVGMLADESDSLSVLFGVAIWCGEDDVLAVLRKRGRTWQVTMIYESDGYNTVDKAFGAMQLSTLDNGRILAVAHIDPWCSSNWRKITVALLKERVNDRKPEIVNVDSETIYLGVDDPIFMLTPDRNGDAACLQFTGEEQSMTGVPAKKAISYSYRKGKVTKSVGCQ